MSTYTAAQSWERGAWLQQELDRTAAMGEEGL